MIQGLKGLLMRTPPQPPRLCIALLAVATTVVCGASAGLFDGTAGAAVTELDAAGLAARRAPSTRLQLFNFYAPWCGHCQHFAPIYAEVAQSLHERGAAADLNAINCMTRSDVCNEQEVKSFPTVEVRLPASSSTSSAEDVVPLPLLSVPHDVRVDAKTLEQWIVQRLDPSAMLLARPAAPRAVVRREHPTSHVASATGSAKKRRREGVEPGFLLRLEDAERVAVHGLRADIFRGVSASSALPRQRLVELRRWIGILATRWPIAAVAAAGTAANGRSTRKRFAALQSFAESPRMPRVSEREWQLQVRIAFPSLSFVAATASAGVNANAPPWRTCSPADVSKPHLRGYPCALWTMFHILAESTSSSSVEAVELCRGVEGYIRLFFACSHCRDHFLAMRPNVQGVERLLKRRGGLLRTFKHTISSFDDRTDFVWYNLCFHFDGGFFTFMIFYD